MAATRRFFNGYRPQFYFRTTDVTGVVNLPKGVEMIMPGDNFAVDIELIVPIAMEKLQKFAIREGGPHHRCRSCHRDRRVTRPITSSDRRCRGSFGGPGCVV